MTGAKLTLHDVAKHYPQRDRRGSAVIFEGVNCAIAAGEFVAIVGPSGCGKSTLLHMIAGLIPASAGGILIDGRPVTGPGPDRGVLFQDYALFPWLTVEQNIAFGLRYGPKRHLLSAAEREAVVRAQIELVHLTGAERKFPHQLSGGMRQRCALARLFANGSDVLLMDEPLAALDAQTREVLQEELLRIWGEGSSDRRTVIYITHSIDEAVFLSDRIIVMGSRPGRIREVLNNPLPRPRTRSLKGDPTYQDLNAGIWQLIRSEAYTATVSG